MLRIAYIAVTVNENNGEQVEFNPGRSREPNLFRKIPIADWPCRLYTFDFSKAP